MEKKIVVISDLHLGYENCDKSAIDDFLDAMQTRTDITDLVLLGDIVDMWRRDASGVFLENRETINKIIDLSKRIRLYYVAGNHDHHVLHLKNDKPSFSYPLEFHKNIRINDGQYTYRFVHGHEFEYHDDPAKYSIMDPLCRAMSDERGHIEDETWGLLTKDWGETKYFFSILSGGMKRRIKTAAREVLGGPEIRLKDSLKEIDKRAAKAQGGKPNEILVYGHTHRPFVNRNENLANSGSWVTDAETHNTYLELFGGKPRLFIFGGKEITERVDLSY